VTDICDASVHPKLSVVFLYYIKLIISSVLGIIKIILVKVRKIYLVFGYF